MTEALFVKTLGALRPADEEGTEALSKIKDGDTIKVKWSRPRNLRHHQLYWSLCNLVADNTDSYKPATVNQIIKFGIKHYDLVPIPTEGGIPKQLPVLKSISFAAMDQTAFDKFFNDAIDFILQTILRGTDKEDLRREVYERIGINIAA